MKRRNFIKSLSVSGSAIIATPSFSAPFLTAGLNKNKAAYEKVADIVIAGGGMGGCAAAIAALRNGWRVIMTEETDWIGGQLTQQGVSCPDEHQWIESFGATQSYGDLRTAIREYYIRLQLLPGQLKILTPVRALFQGYAMSLVWH